MKSAKAGVLYVDETGSFRASSASGKLGLRAVGGLWLCGDLDEHERVLRPRLAQTLGWAAPLSHACEMTPYKLGRLLRRLPVSSVPARFRAAHSWLQDHPCAEVYRKCPDWVLLWTEAQRLRDAMFNLVGEALRTFSGRIIVALEFDLSPTDSRYPAMLQAVIERAIWLPVRTPTVLPLTAVIEGGADGAQDPPLNTAALRAWTDGLRSVGLRPTSRVEHLQYAPKASAVGLVLADHLLARLAPSARRHWPPAAEPQTRLDVLRSRVPPPVDAGEPILVLTDGLCAGPLLRRLGRCATVGEVLSRAEAQLRDGVPSGVYPAVLEDLIENLRRSGERP